MCFTFPVKVEWKVQYPTSQPLQRAPDWGSIACWHCWGSSADLPPVIMFTAGGVDDDSFLASCFAQWGDSDFMLVGFYVEVGHVRA